VSAVATSTRTGQRTTSAPSTITTNWNWMKNSRRALCHRHLDNSNWNLNRAPLPQGPEQAPSPPRQQQSEAEQQQPHPQGPQSMAGKCPQTSNVNSSVPLRDPFSLGPLTPSPQASPKPKSKKSKKATVPVANAENTGGSSQDEKFDMQEIAKQQKRQ